MTVEQELQLIQQSLEEPEAPTKPVVKGEASAADFTQALITLPKILPLLKTLIDEQHKENNYISILTQIDTDMELLTNKISSNLDTTLTLQKDVKTRLDSFNLLEAKYTLMIERVNNVLSQLEKYLEKQ